MDKKKIKTNNLPITNIENWKFNSANNSVLFEFYHTYGDNSFQCIFKHRETKTIFHDYNRKENDRIVLEGILVTYEEF